MRNYLALLLALVLVSSCNDKEASEFTKLKVVFSKSQSKGRWIPGTVANTSSLRCLGISVTDPGDIKGTCTNLSNASAIGLTAISNMIYVPSGGTSASLTLNVKQGPGKTVRIFGLEGTGDCPSLAKISEVNQGNFKTPISVNMGTFDFNNRDITLNLDLTSAFAGAVQTDFCSGEIFTGGASSSVCTGSESALNDHGSGTALDPYIICNEAQFTLLADTSLAGELDDSYALGANILITTPKNTIGDSTTAFSGTFDGRNYKIIDWHSDLATASYLGVFGNLNSATVSNLVLEFPSGATGLTVNNAGFKIGILAGNVGSSTIDNIKITGDVLDINVSGTGNFNIGGILGLVDSSTISNIRGEIPINIATPSALGQSLQQSGLLAYNVENSQVSNIVVRGSFDLSNANSAYQLGGVIGRVAAPSSPSTLTNLSANVTISTPNTGNYAGGLIGYIEPLSNNVTVTNCRAVGVSTLAGAFNTAGGLIGQIDDAAAVTSISNCYSSVSITDSAPDSVNLGGLVGSRVGASGTVSLNNSFYGGSMVSSGTASKGFLVGTGETEITFNNAFYSSAITTCPVTCKTEGTDSAGSILDYVNVAIPALFSSWDFVGVWATNPPSLPKLLIE